MDAKALLPKEHVIIGLAGETPRDILRCLIEPLMREGIVSDDEAFLDALQAREAEVSTQLENGVAFPHARSAAVKRLALTVGLAPATGLAFSPEAESPCRAFFLIAIPAIAPTAHLPLLRRLASFAHTDGKIERLLRARTPGAAARIITTYRG